MYDLHIHTNHSPDAKPGSSMEAYAARALELGYRGIGFTDHLEFDPDDEGFGFLDYDQYSRDIDRVRLAYEGRLSIYKGVEVSYQREFSDKPASWFRGKDFDFIIGAVHFVGREPFHKEGSYFRGKSPEQAFRPYFEEVRRAVESGLFDVLGHLDHLKRYSTAVFGPYSPDPYADQIRDILKAVLKSGCALELNTSGFRHAFREPFPCLPTLQEFARLGGTAVTLGSDSHAIDHFHAGIPESTALAHSAGMTEQIYFVSRKKQVAVLGAPPLSPIRGRGRPKAG
ncbi:histidinol-phosphatase [bacterium]|nr:histidinol-phosphatase [bacterium]